MHSEFHRVIETLVKVGENSQHTAFLVLPNFQSCFYISIETRYMKRWNDCSTAAKCKLELMISRDFYHDVVLLLTPITNITECYFLVVENKIRTVEFDVVQISRSISTATPVTAITLHRLVWALSFRYVSEQAVLHISTYPLLELFTIVMLQTFLFILWLL